MSYRTVSIVSALRVSGGGKVGDAYESFMREDELGITPGQDDGSNSER